MAFDNAKKHWVLVDKCILIWVLVADCDNVLLCVQIAFGTDNIVASRGFLESKRKHNTRVEYVFAYIQQTEEFRLLAWPEDQPTRMGQYGHLSGLNRNRQYKQTEYYKNSHLIL